jgi:hypothetical protein
VREYYGPDQRAARQAGYKPALSGTGGPVGSALARADEDRVRVSIGLGDLADHLVLALS